MGVSDKTHTANKDMRPLLITIDGPAGAGKTTVGRMLADRLSYTYVDTGALYRAVALEVHTRNIDPGDDIALKHLCDGLQLKLVRENTGLRLLLNGRDVSGRIRTPEITMLASAVSARPVVRQCLLDLQRQLGRKRSAVFEGRDMGTVVFPDADVKFYLDASPKIRAYRRYTELKAKTSQTLDEVEKDLICRDKNDSSRRAAPLRPADGSIRIDATDMTAAQVVEAMLAHINKLARM